MSDVNARHQQLLLVKYLFRSGQNALAEKSMFSAGLAVSLFQDAIERLAWTIAKEFDAKVSDKTAFEQMWELVKTAPKNTQAKELPLRAKVLDLNKARVGFKHYGNLPAVDDAVKFETYTQQFLNVACSEFFGIEFERISLVDLIEDERAATYLHTAEKALAADDVKAVLDQCGRAYFYLSRPFDALVPPISNKLTQTAGNLPHEIRHGFEDGIRELEESFRALRNLSLTSSLGITLADFLRYRAIAPRAWEMSSGQLNVVWDYATKRANLDDARFAIHYVTSFGLALQTTLKGMKFTDRDLLFRAKSLGRN